RPDGDRDAVGEGLRDVVQRIARRHLHRGRHDPPRRRVHRLNAEAELDRRSGDDLERGTVLPSHAIRRRRKLVASSRLVDAQVGEGRGTGYKLSTTANGVAGKNSATFQIVAGTPVKL